MRLRSVTTWFLLLFQLWLAHLIGFMMHEYAHSFLAWFFHAKANPFALNYGQFTVGNVLLQADIDENVDYDPIFAAGRGQVAALIAVGGVLIGNGISYLASRFLFASAKKQNRPLWAMFFFWVCVMSVGNFLSYVPIRTFASHADMATVTRGLGVSPWVIAIGLGIPFAVATVHFFAKILPAARGFLFPGNLLGQRVLVGLTVFLVFFFFGSAGINGYGAASHWQSVLSELVLFPIVAIVCMPRKRGQDVITA